MKPKLSNVGYMISNPKCVAFLELYNIWHSLIRIYLMLSKKFVLHVMHFITLKRILRYLKGTLMHDIDILLLVIDHLVSYSDVDLVGSSMTFQSTFRLNIYLDDKLLL